MPLIQIISIVLVIFLAIGLAIWAVRRHRRLKYQRIKTRLRYQKVNPDDFKDDEYGSELPSGGARVVAKRDNEDIESVNARIRQQAEANRPKLSIRSGAPLQQSRLDLGDDEPEETSANDSGVPLLLDPAEGEVAAVADQPAEPEESVSEVDEDQTLSSEPPVSDTEPSQQDIPAAELSDAEISAVEASESSESSESEEPEVEESTDDILFSEPTTTEPRRRSQLSAGGVATAQDEDLVESIDPVEEPEEESVLHESQDSTAIVDSEVSAQAGGADELNIDSSQAVANQGAATEAANTPNVRPSEPEQAALLPDEAEEEEEAAAANADEVIIINLMVRDGGQYFSGDAIQQVLEKQGMKLGQMDIFHFQSDISGRGVRFSAANILNPGTFPAGQMRNFSTPGICFFMSLNPGYANQETFNRLMEVARTTAAALGGDLKDQNRSYLTGQTVEHLRSQIADYQRKLLLR